MNGIFRFEDFRPLTLEDRLVLEPRLTASPEQSCEFLFANLYNWCHSYFTRWQDCHGILVFWMETEDLTLMAEAPGRIQPEDCLAVSAEMRKHGFSGRIHHIRQDTLDRLSELKTLFHAEQMSDDFGEYLYDVESLAELHGEKFSKKRNLIAQFKRNFPDYRVVRNEPSVIPSARKLAEAWLNGQENPNDPELIYEADALDRAFDHWQMLDMETVAVLYHEEVIAFSMLTKINSEIWDEPFEKSDRRFKGVSQLITSESARTLIGKCRLLNREQDLGKPGMRQAKLSYMPEQILKNYLLIPR